MSSSHAMTSGWSLWGAHTQTSQSVSGTGKIHQVLNEVCPILWKDHLDFGLGLRLIENTKKFKNVFAMYF